MGFHCLRLQQLVLGFLCMVMLVPAHAIALSPKKRGKIKALAERVHSQGKYPAALPSNTLAPPKKRTVSWLERWLQKLFRKGASKTMQLGESFGVVLKGMVLVLLVAVGLLLLWALVRLFSRGGPVTLDDGRRQAEGGFLGYAFHDDMDPGQEAGEGRFALAICLLLWKAFRRTGWRPEGRGASQTGRELLARVPEGASWLPPIRRLLALAESVRFGDRSADYSLFLKAEQHFQLFEEQFKDAHEGDTPRGNASKAVTQEDPE